MIFRSEGFDYTVGRFIQFYLYLVTSRGINYFRIKSQFIKLIIFLILAVANISGSLTFGNTAANMFSCGVLYGGKIQYRLRKENNCSDDIVVTHEK